jgi:hypothetical protein
MIADHLYDDFNHYLPFVIGGADSITPVEQQRILAAEASPGIVSARPIFWVIIYTSFTHHTNKGDCIIMDIENREER